jgi:ribonucleotide reductase beta subunit family protein with ferritin-like domain
MVLCQLQQLIATAETMSNGRSLHKYMYDYIIRNFTGPENAYKAYMLVSKMTGVCQRKKG